MRKRICKRTLLLKLYLICYVNYFVSPEEICGKGKGSCESDT
ncbi:Uncharacterised protein [Segatella copri]|nr:Uncharacterised protein [Segatella copri]